MASSDKSDKFTKVYMLLWGIFIFVALVSFVLYKVGFRLGDNFEPVKVGSVQIFSNESGFQVLVDNKEKQVLSKDNSYYIQNITPGLHSVMIFKKDFWPWAKTVSVAENSVQPVFAFIFPTEGIKTEVVPADSTDYSSILKNIDQNIASEVKFDSLPPEGNESYSSWLVANVPDRKISADGTTALFTENNTIYAVWVSDTETFPHYFCEENPCKFKLPITVLSENIKNIDFYKNRRDMIIFAAGSAIYAIEADHAGNQNFQPLYKGVDPYFYENSDGVIYIKDGNSLLRAKL